MTTFFKKSRKPYLRVILVPFHPYFNKKNSWEKACQFLNITIIHHCVKNQKKLMTRSREKSQTEK